MSPTATPAALRRLVALLAPDNAIARAEWVREALARLPPGQSILDAGAGEMQYRTHPRGLAHGLMHGAPAWA